MYAPDSRRLIGLPEMPTQSENTQRTECLIKELIDKYHLPVANWRKHFDGTRTIVVREAVSTGEMQVTLITVGKKINGLEKLAQEVVKLDNVVSVFQSETDWNSPRAWGNKTAKLAGKNQIIERILDKKFALSPRAFFQPNPEQTEILYSEAVKLLNLTPDQTLIDAYGGVEAIGIIASDYAKQVIGIESIPETVEDAMRNTKLNHVRSIEYLQSSIKKILSQLKNSGVPIDALIVDPPRTGLAKFLIKTITQAGPKSFAYISCNSPALAQDLVMLGEVYDVRVIENVDMLPQITRCEAIAKLVLRKEN